MTGFEAILLGIVQGLTEFLPISSTAHLTLAGRLLGISVNEDAAAWTAFIAVIQLGTLLAVISFFFRELARMPVSVLRDIRSPGRLFRPRDLSAESRIAFMIIIGTIPLGAAGLLLSDFLHGLFTKNLLVIGSSLILLALFLWLAEKRAKHVRGMEDLRWSDAVVIGLAQCLALIPGSSRSGTTITAGLFLGLTRSAAARFSFLLSIPAVFASGVYELVSMTADPFAFGTLNVILAVLAAAVSGYASIAWLLRYLMKQTMMAFVWYRILLGLLLITLITAGWLSP